jgi:hypothetical protein
VERVSFKGNEPWASKAWLLSCYFGVGEIINNAAVHEGEHTVFVVCHSVVCA